MYLFLHVIFVNKNLFPLPHLINMKEVPEARWSEGHSTGARLCLSSLVSLDPDAGSYPKPSLLLNSVTVCPTQAGGRLTGRTLPRPAGAAAGAWDLVALLSSDQLTSSQNLVNY